MRIETIERLVRRLEQADITMLAITDATSSLTLRLAPAPGALGPEAPAPPPASAPEPRWLRARAIGRLRLSHPEAAARDDNFPRAVAAGDIVAFLEAGALLRPVVAEEAGRIGPPLVAEGALIGYGTPLFPLL